MTVLLEVEELLEVGVAEVGDLIKASIALV